MKVLFIGGTGVISTACTTPFTWGAKGIASRYAADAARQEADEELNALMDRILDAYEAAFPRR